jgi:flagellar motor switch protein FliN/FliY
LARHEQAKATDMSNQTDLQLDNLAQAGAPPPARGEDPPPRGPRTAADLEQVLDVPVNISAVLGRTRMEIGQLLRIAPGQVLELDRKIGEAIDIYVNNRLVARGEVVLVEEKLGVTMTEIIRADR